MNTGGTPMQRYDELQQELLFEAEQVRNTVNTHCHHLPSAAFESISLHKLMQMTYIGWSNAWFPDTPAERTAYIERNACNTYFQWMARSVGQLYGNGTPLDASNWDAIDAALQFAHAKHGHDLRLLVDVCGYSRIILDKYERPGHNLWHPELFQPTFRCDMFLHGYAADGQDQNGNSPYDHLDVDATASLEEYIQSVSRAIASKKKDGCVALKLAIAYERDLAFENTDPAKASLALQAARNEKGLSPTGNGTSLANQTEIRNYQDYVVYRLAGLAADSGMPFQIHTGLGKLDRSNAICLRRLIDRNPETRFVLFHCGYPWMDDVLGLLHNYRNVYPDLCWLPLISTSAAIRFIREAFEVGDANRLTWGCDTWTSEESHGALLAIRHSLSSALASMCREGLVDLPYAKQLVHGVLYKNAQALYSWT